MRRVLLGAVVLFMAACGGGGDAGGGDTMTPPPAPPPPPPPPAANVQLPEGVTQEMVTQGQVIFTGKGLCHTCHGQDASGTQLAPNLRDTTWLNLETGSYEEIVNVIKTGVNPPKEHPAPMLPRAGTTITDDEVNQVAAYVYSISRGS